MDELHSEDPDSPAHAVACHFLDDWLEPFVRNYACVALVDDDARKESLPLLIKNMSSRDCNKMCLNFSYLAKQHKDFSPTGRWVEWVVPAIAFLFRFGKEATTATLTSHTLNFFDQLIRLSAYWLFCTTDETNYAQRRALASQITGQVLKAKDVADSVAQMSSWQLSSKQAQTFASSVETLAARPADSIYQEGKPPMRNRQMLMLRCIELKEDVNSEIDRFPKAELEHVAPQGMKPKAWPKWDVQRGIKRIACPTLVLSASASCGLPCFYHNVSSSQYLACKPKTLHLVSRWHYLFCDSLCASHSAQQFCCTQYTYTQYFCCTHCYGYLDT